MSVKKPLISICIPTFNRANILNKTLYDLIKIKSNKIEFVINDNGSTDDTKEIVEDFKDNRIKYFKNKSNLGFDANILNVIQKSRGKYIFLLSDEDKIETRTFHWLLKTLESSDISLLYGSIISKKRDKLEKYYTYEDKLLKKGSNTAYHLWFKHPYMSGIILRKSALNLNYMKKFVGSCYMHQFLSIYALLNGNVRVTSKIISYNDESGKKHISERNKIFTKISKNHSLPFYHPKSRIIQSSYRQKFIDDLFKKNELIRELLVKKEQKYLAQIFVSTCFPLLNKGLSKITTGIYNFITSIPYLKTVPEITNSVFFWIMIILNLYKNLLSFLNEK